MTEQVEKVPDNMSVYGSTGLKQYGGHVYEEWLTRLQGERGARTYLEMSENDPVIGAMLYAIRSLIRQTSWRIEPVGEDKKAVEAAEFVSSCVVDMSHTFEDFISEILSMLPYGWAYFELCYKHRKGLGSKHQDGKIGWRKIPIRAQSSLDRWEFDDEGGIKGMRQVLPSGGYAFVPIEKALLFRTINSKNSPEGKSILRPAYRPWFFLKRIQEIEAIGIERDLAGLPVATVPAHMLSSTASAAERAVVTALQTTVQQIRRDEREGLVIPAEVDSQGKPTGYTLKLLSTGGRRAIDTNQTIVRYEQRIAMSVLAEFLLLGMDKVGSFALADSKTHLFSVALGAVMDSIASVFNQFAISRLMALNGVDSAYWPKLVHGDIETPDLGALGEFINKMVGAGVIMPGPELERYVRSAARLPQAEE